MNSETIYIPLLNEGADVWAPVTAENLGNGQFRLLGPKPGDQEWAFAVGDVVKVILREFSGSSPALAVIGRAR